jgi:hypothetical protein
VSNHAALAVAARKLAFDLVEFASMLEKRQPKRRSRWIGPVSDEIHDERDAVYTHCFTLAMYLGRDATARGFATRHNLIESEISRWLSLKPRGIAPGSSVDISIRRALQEDTQEYEAEYAKRLGANQIPNFPLRISHRISA